MFFSAVFFLTLNIRYIIMKTSRKRRAIALLHTQQNYDFRKAMLEIHKKDLRDVSVKPGADEFEIKDGMKIVIDENASDVILTAAKDFADYLYTSMGVSVFVKKGTPADGEIYVATKAEINADLGSADSYKGFMAEVADKVTVCGFDDRGAGEIPDSAADRNLSLRSGFRF